MSLPAGHFAALFRTDDDPWGFRSRWYEARKRELTLASLPRPRYRRGFEPGCANGELSAALATRCDQLWASDCDVRAVSLARRRLRDLGHVHAARIEVPERWPPGRFDLVVVSELGYYLGESRLQRLVQRIADSLLPDATVVACHWSRPIEGCALDGDAVNLRIGNHLGLPRQTRILDPDFVLDVWTTDARSVAEREDIP